MTTAVNRGIQSTQEQAVASWVTFLNQTRLDNFVENLNRQDINLGEALKELDELKNFLGHPENILGSSTTKHGEIAEHMQVNFSNARKAIEGLSKNYTFDGVGRTAPEDYLCDGLPVQAKFYNGLKKTFFEQHALLEHLKKYPDFIKNGGSYDIPKDQYDYLVALMDTYKNNPSQLNRSDYTLAKKINMLLESEGLEIGKDIKSAVVKYDEVQQGKAYQTVSKEEKSIKETDKKRREEMYHESMPTFKEAVKIVGVSAALEGGVAFCMSVAGKRKNKKFSDFSVDDWKDVGIDTGKGTVKGGIRGGSIYALTNFTATPANVASAYVTAAFGVAAQIKALDKGTISKEDFILNCETVCLDVSISAISSLAGQMIIPVPILGAVIGNTVGEFVYELCKKQGSLKSKEIIESYHTEMINLNQKLDIQYFQVVMEIQKELEKFKDLEALAFNEDVNVAFQGSIDLARASAVEESKILKTISDIDNFFLM